VLYDDPETYKRKRKVANRTYKSDINKRNLFYLLNHSGHSHNTGGRLKISCVPGGSDAYVYV